MPTREEAIDERDTSRVPPQSPVAAISAVPTASITQKSTLESDTAEMASTVQPPIAVPEKPRRAKGEGAEGAPPSNGSATRRIRSADKELRIANQPAFVLHSYPYKETSLIVDVFSRDHGRIPLIAKGAKRPHSTLRGVLQTFQPLVAGWIGRAEVRTLTTAEWVGGMLPLEKSALLSGFYLNELLVKLLARDDPHPVLFDHYVKTLNRLAHGETVAIVLRQFERALLKETGVASDLTTCAASRQPVDAQRMYVVDPERGPRPATVADVWPRIAGKTLLDMEREDYSDATTQAQSKALMRFLVQHQLGNAQLNTRQILIDLMQL